MWDLPSWLWLLVVGVVAVYGAAIPVAVVAGPRVQLRQLWLFGLLVACSAVAVEFTRRSGERPGVVRDVYAIWDLPCALLLPPVWSLLAPVPRQMLSYLRVRRGVVHRRVFSAAVVGLAYAAASTVFHAVAPDLGPGAGTGTGGHAVLWSLLAAGCAVLRLVINDGLVCVAVKGSAPETSLTDALLAGQSLHAIVEELAIGVLAAFAAAHSMLLVLWAVPLVISLQRSLRHQELVAEARTDGKTGLLTDAAWRRRAAHEVERAARTRSPIAIGILDIDHFKSVNDTYGHLAGDVVLSAIAAFTRAELRPYDLVGRIGGEEFAFILPQTAPERAVEVAERLRAMIPEVTIPQPDPGTTVPSGVTVSIGVAAADSGPGWDLLTYLSRADQALYAAKANGRDGVWVIRQSDPQPRPALAAQEASAGRAGPALSAR